MMGVQAASAQLFYDFCSTIMSLAIICCAALTASRARGSRSDFEAVLQSDWTTLD